MYCKNCGEFMNDNQAICLKCGVKAGEGTMFCQNCGSTVEPGADVCLHCGCSVKKKGFLEGNLAGQNKITIAIICFFLGGIGIHNFIMGENKKGIFKIIMCFCCGIGYIFALVDFVKILMDRYEVDPTKLI